jgi:signal transduction histidine kinase
MVERAARVTAPAVLVLFVVVGATVRDRPAGAVAALGLAAAVSGGAIAWRRLTGWALVGALAVPAALLVVACDRQASNAGWFGICVLAGWAALEAALVPAVVTTSALVGMFLVQSTVVSDDSGWTPWMVGTLFTAVVCGFARRQRTLVEQLQQAQAGLAERARAEERNRVAGEMHDVIGHALTVSLLHVSSARLALDDDPEEARASLLEAERLARQSLEEVRAAVGLLRAADADNAAPMPSAADLPRLVESFRLAGTPVRLDVRGDTTVLGSNRGLAVYRIVQESLTNAARHGDGSPVVVHVDVADGSTTVTVDSGGAPGSAVREGSGLVGMRERAEAFGGRLVAGPRSGGWRVEAVLPT